MKKVIFLAVCLVTSVTSAQLPQVNTAPDVRDQLSSALDVKFAKFSFHEQSIYTFVRRFEDATGIAVCAGLPPDYNAGSDLAIEVVDATPREILNEVVRQRPEFVWRQVGGSLVHIVPAEELSDTNLRLSSEILNLPSDTIKLEQVDDLQFYNSYSLKLLSGTGARIYAQNSELTLSLAPHPYTLKELLDAFCMAAAPTLAWELVGHTFHFKSLMSLRDVETRAMSAYREYQSDSQFNVEKGLTMLAEALQESPYSRARVKIASEMGKLIESTSPATAAKLYSYLIEHDEGWQDSIYTNMHSWRTHAWILDGKRDEARATARALYESSNDVADIQHGIGRVQLILTEGLAVSDIDTAEANLRDLLSRYPDDNILAERVAVALNEIVLLRETEQINAEANRQMRQDVLFEELEH